MILTGSLACDISTVEVCKAKVHVVPLVMKSVQVAVVWLVVVRQLPQFDARML